MREFFGLLVAVGLLTWGTFVVTGIEFWALPLNIVMLIWMLVVFIGYGKWLDRKWKKEGTRR